MIHKVLIVEDEELAAKRLQKMITSLDPSLEVIATTDSVQSTVEWLGKNTCPDLIFMDIQLADGLSFAIFEEVNPKCPVIFTTAYDEYAIKAFELNSIDYLLKPIDVHKLSRAVEKYKTFRSPFQGSDFLDKMSQVLTATRVQAGFRNRFLIPKGETLIPVSTGEVAYFLAEDKVVILVTREGKKHLLGQSLEKLEEELDPAMFFRVNRQCLVAANAIRKVHVHFNYKLKLDLQPAPDEEIIVSKSRAAEFKQWMNR